MNLWGLENVTSFSGTSPADEVYQKWASAMQQYTQNLPYENAPRLSFWLIVGIPGRNFGDNIEWHESLPVLMPTEDYERTAHIARDRMEVDDITASEEKNVHLTYKIKIQGYTAFKGLIEFLAENNMLEKD